MRTSFKPQVGISTDLRIPAKGRAPVCVVPTGYVDCVLQAGGVPIILPPLTKEPEMRPIMDRLDALILTGGDDLDPKRLGMPPHPLIKPALPRREDCDRLLIKLAAARRMPILGVGFGMQLMNVVFGGTIYQHLPEDLPKALPHKDPLGNTHRHGLEIQPGTRIDDIYGDGEIRVNSSHHQAVRRVSNKFRISATAPDGVIEAIESLDPEWFAMGVQWNPASETASALDMQLFEALLAACEDGALAAAA
jgi:putative glutamine amidotransferase